MRRRAWAAPLGCGLLGAVLFAPAVGSGRLADDFVLLRTVRRATGILWPFGHNDLGQAAGAGHFYRPLWVLWNAAIYQLSHSPAAAHALNLVLFGTVCAEVVVLVRRAAGPSAALFAGVLFAVFPSHGESVAWISGNTDLVAVALALAALLCADRLPLAVALTVAAMLAKEEAVVLPVLAALLIWTRSGERDWRPVIAILVAVIAVLIAHVLVVSGVGGYGPSFTAKRAAGSFVSFTVAALSAPQLALLRDPLLLAVPIALFALVAWGAWRAVARARRLALAGAAWFVVSLLPVLNEPLNLNTRNGDRLLLLPSVGIALGAGVLLARARGRGLVVAAGAVAALAAVSCVCNAFDWRTAGVESRRLLADVDRLAPRGASLVALSVPTDYRAAHLYPDALDVALQESGRPDLSLTQCMPVHVLSLRPRQVTFRRPVGGGPWLGRTTTSAPFDVPVLGGSASASAGCTFAKAPNSASAGLGTALSAIVTPPPAPAPAPALAGSGAIPIYFDGRDMVRTPG